MPREQGVRADNGADFPEHPPRQELSFGGQANALIVGEAQPARAELRAEHAILGLEIVDHVALLLVDPARQGHNEELERIREPSHELSVSEERSGLVQVASSPGYISQARSIARISTPIELLDTRGSRRRYARFVTVLAGGCADNGRPCVPKWRCRVSAIRRVSAPFLPMTMSLTGFVSNAERTEGRGSAFAPRHDLVCNRAPPITARMVSNLR